MRDSTVVFGVLMVATFVAAAGATVVMFTAKQTQQAVLQDVSEQDLEEEFIVKTLFSVQSPTFTNSSCDSLLSPMTLDIYFQYGLAPESCTVFVNDKVVLYESDLDPSCVGQCPVGEFTRSFSLGTHDNRDAHVIRVCCDDRCLRKSLAAAC